MKRELWRTVKRGTWLIYADEYEGVYRCMVTEVDIRIYEPGTPSRWGNPYGLTAQTGTVKIRYDEGEKIENLANLVAYSSGKLMVLRRDWNRWQKVKASAEAYRETYLARIQGYKEL